MWFQLLSLLKIVFGWINTILIQSVSLRVWQLLLLFIGLLYAYNRLSTPTQQVVIAAQPSKTTQKAKTIDQTATIQTLVNSIVTHVSNADSAEATRQQLTKAAFHLPADSLQCVIDSLFPISPERHGFVNAPPYTSHRKPSKASHR